MKRDYQSGETDSVVFFTGVEVEHTPAFWLKTLFVVGVQPVEAIEKAIESDSSVDDPIKHIFFGANHSFKPQTFEQWNEWESMITEFLDKGFLCSLDIPIEAALLFNETSLNEFNNFIPQIRVPIPYVKLWNYNTMVKIDDLDFNYSNPGVWSHSLHDLMDRSKFTDWSKYKQDKILS